MPSIDAQAGRFAHLLLDLGTGFCGLALKVCAVLLKPAEAVIIFAVLSAFVVIGDGGDRLHRRCLPSRVWCNYDIVHPVPGASGTSDSGHELLGRPLLTCISFPSEPSLTREFSLLFPTDAFGIFASRLSSPALTYALGLSAALLAMSITVAGLALHFLPSPSRPLTLLSALLLLLAALAPAFPASSATLEPSSALLALAATATGLAFGAMYVISIHVAQLWFPASAGTATGAVVTASGLGSLLFVRLNAALVATRPVPAAMRASALVAAGLAFVAAAGIVAPPEELEPALASPAVAPAGDESEEELLKGPVEVAEAHEHIGVAAMLSSPTFYYLLISICATVGPGFGVVLSASRMQTVLLSVSPADADTRFFYITLVGVAGRLAVGVITDLYARRLTGANADLRAAKSVTRALLLMQFFALGMARFAVITGAPRTFAISLAAVYLSFSGGAVVTGCLCKALFPGAATLAFALLGTSIGAGDAMFSAVMASCVGTPGAASQNEYDLYFGYAGAISVVGLVACEFIGRTGGGKSVEKVREGYGTVACGDGRDRQESIV